MSPRSVSIAVRAHGSPSLHRELQTPREGGGPTPGGDLGRDSFGLRAVHDAEPSTAVVLGDEGAGRARELEHRRERTNRTDPLSRVYDPDLCAPLSFGDGVHPRRAQLRFSRLLTMTEVDRQKAVRKKRAARGDERVTRNRVARQCDLGDESRVIPRIHSS